MKMNEDLKKINLCNIIQIISIVMFLAQLNQVFNWISVDIKHWCNAQHIFSPRFAMHINIELNTVKTVH